MECESRRDGTNPMYQVPKLTDYSPAALDKAVAEARLAVRDELREVKSDADLKKVRDR